MPKTKISFDELLEVLEKLPYKQFKEAVEYYSKYNKANFEEEMDALVSHNFQTRFEKLRINAACPKCGSINFVKNGKRKYTQRYRCNECNNRFTLFTDTILEKTKWHWDIWVKVLQMTINDFSILEIKNVLEKDYGYSGVNSKTIFLWIHKLIYSIATIPQPILTGIIQIDETFIREAQKGSKSLYSTISQSDNRLPRYGRQPSKLGTMGPEFATVVAAVDNRGYCVCKVVTLGRLTKELFTDLFESYLCNPAYICTDANTVYDEYCKLFHIPHYIVPSRYNEIISKSGIKSICHSPEMFNKLNKNNRAAYERLYRNHEIDQLTNVPIMSYLEFLEIKQQNKLSLLRVDSFHAKIKEKLYIERRNVSTKYLKDYIGFITYIHNWKVTNGNNPTSVKEAESIFIEILKTRVKYTVSDIKNAELDLPKPSSRYVSLLKDETEKMRTITHKPGLKFDEEDNVISFNKREYLISQGKSKLRKICSEHKIPGYTQYTTSGLAIEILRMADSNEIIYNLIAKDKKLSQEDLDYMKRAMS